MHPTHNRQSLGSSPSRPTTLTVKEYIMSKTVIDGVVKKGKKSKDANGNRIVKKVLSHGTYRCKRHPTSKRCKAA